MPAHCGTYHCGDGDADHHDGAPEPAPCHHQGDGSCQHCEATMIAQSAPDLHVLASSAFFLAWVPPVIEVTQAKQFDPTLAVLDGIPPPIERPSLLSLHCALTL